MYKKYIVIAVATVMVSVTFVNADESQLNVNAPDATVLEYDKSLYERLTDLSGSRLKDGKILLMTTTHQDIAWLDSPENCIKMRDELWLTPYFERLKNEPDFKFDIEDALIIREYIERYPERKQEIQNYLSEGRLSCGATYTQPYEEMYSGESLIRQFYLGKRWLAKEFGGYKADVYWNVDVPGRTLQMPQILEKSRTKYMMISRHGRGLLDWYSPDGSKVTAYSPGHYIAFYDVLKLSDLEASKTMAEKARMWYTDYNNVSAKEPVMPAMLNFEFIWDMKPVYNCIPFMKKWNSIQAIEDSSGKVTELSLPKFEFATADHFFKTVSASSKDLPSIRGERPAVWLYIHGPGHHKALKASREGDVLLTSAEKFATIEALLAGSFDDYPSERLTRVWEAKIYPDHGWGGKNGDITDSTFLRKFEFARQEAKQILDNSLESIASRVKADQSKGDPVIVFNNLSYCRTDPVAFSINFEQGQARDIEVVDEPGSKVISQLSDTSKYQDGSLKSATVRFVAKEVPSIGYKTYYIQPVKTSAAKSLNAGIITCDNRYYRVKFGKGGISSIYDKRLKKELLDTAKYLAGEVYTLQSVGHGAGEFAAPQLPTMKDFDKTGNYDVVWKCVESGSLYDVYRFRQPIRNAVVEQKVIVYHSKKKIDFETAILDWEGIQNREYRMAMPLNMKGAHVAYEVPFGVVEVGKSEIKGSAGERYQTVNKDLHPRGIENWISASGNGFGVTFSSSVAVVDYIDPADHNSDTVILQPLLLASRRSCHGEGPWYLQKGDHYFHFSITSHEPDWQNGYRFGIAANNPLRAVVGVEAMQNAILPEEQSFCSVSQDNVMISTIKKCEDDDSVIARLYDIKGKDSDVTLTTFFDIKGAEHTNIIEEEGQTIPASGKTLKTKIGHHAIETFKLLPENE